MVKLKIFICLNIFLSTLFSCDRNNNYAVHLKNDRDSFFYYLDKGDEAYAVKEGYKSFETSLHFYNKAQELADKRNDTLMLAEAVFAKGRVFDAWNKEPQATIQNFKKAAELFLTMDQTFFRYLYAKHLVAHAYDKIHDSSNTVKVLKELFDEIKALDTTIKKQIPFTTEMALISTEVKNYKLAELILKTLSHRNWIRNDSETYDYLNHYYLCRSRLDVYGKRRSSSIYIDSLQSVFEQATNIMDRMYYSSNLSELYAATKNFERAYEMLLKSKMYSDSLNDTASISSMENALLKSELGAEKRRLEYQKSIRKTWITTIWSLGILLGIITLLSIHLQRQKRNYIDQAKKLEILNNILDKKIHQVETLNKELNHRVKNNLHMVFSLLQMQERRTQHKKTKENLQAAMLRIESIASLYDEIIKIDGTPNLYVHINRIVSTAVNCIAHSKKVIANITVDAHDLKPNLYLPITLIINEWVTNSIKYAAVKDEIIELNITLKKTEEGFSFSFCDNGAIQAKNEVGLGSQIVAMLCRQISGELTTLQNNPYNYQIRI